MHQDPMNVGCQFVDGLFSYHLNLKFIDLSPPLFIAECFLKLLLLKRRWHKRSAVTEEFYIQLCTYNSLPAKAWC